MLDVFFTVDVEVWCDGWDNLDQSFPPSYQQYVYGNTSKGSFGLPYQLELLNEHGLTGVFFVEPLFATRFGLPPLQEIVQLIESSNQEVQLHMHTEWVDEATPSVLANSQTKRQHLFHFSQSEQTQLLSLGKDLLQQAGAGEVNAFRAGNFGFNKDTLSALAANGIRFDSSYNQLIFGPQSGVAPGQPLIEPMEYEGVIEYPMTYFKDALGQLRHVQLGACSFGEIEALLWQALEQERKSFVILFHNFELLNPSRTAPDDIVVARFKKLCAFLSRHSDSFRSCGFRELQPKLATEQPAPLNSNLWQTGTRMFEQAFRRAYA